MPEIDEVIRQKDWKTLKGILVELESQDIAEMLEDIPYPEKVIIFRLLSKEQANETFSYMESDEQEEMLHHFSKNEIKDIINGMDPDDRNDLFDELPAGLVKKYLEFLTPDEREVAALLLNYPEHSAGHIMTTDFIELYEDITADEAINYIRKNAKESETIYISYVIGHHRELVGVVSLKDLILAKPEVIVKEIMDDNPIYVNTMDDQENVANLMKKYDFLAIPVVDSDGRLVGIVTFDDIMDIIEDENTEDFQKMAAMSPMEMPYFSLNTIKLAWNRFIWIFVLIVLESISGNIIQRYQDVLKVVVALAIFIPMITDTGGNAGTQSSTIVIRGLATGDIELKDIFRLILRELLIGILIASAIGIVAFVRAYLFHVGSLIALTVAIAILITIFVSNLTGAFLPFLFKSLKVDPAIAAGPFITTIVDITGLVIYFEVAKRLLHI